MFSKRGGLKINSEKTLAVAYITHSNPLITSGNVPAQSLKCKRKTYSLASPTGQPRTDLVQGWLKI